MPPYLYATKLARENCQRPKFTTKINPGITGRPVVHAWLVLVHLHSSLEEKSIKDL